MSLDKLISTVAEALAPSITDTPNPNNWMDRQRSLSIKASTQTEVVQTLMSLGLFTVTASAATTMMAEGHRPPAEQVEAALVKHNVGVSDRIALKVALDRFSRLKK